MMTADLRRIEKQVDVSFEHGQIVGKKVSKAVKRTSIFLFVLGASVVLSVVFFIYGFFDHKAKDKL